MKKIITIFVIGVVLVAGYFLLNTTPGTTSIKVASASPITVYREPNCGCCGNYVSYLKKHGFEVNDVLTDNIDLIKDQYDVPANMQSCHTSVINGYVAEGHIPLEAVEKLLTERPEINGIALPGMPSGSPGMPGQKIGSTTIHSLLKDGSSGIFLEL